METVASTQTRAELGIPAVTPILPIVTGGDDGPGKKGAADRIDVGRSEPDENFPVVFFGKKGFRGGGVGLPRGFIEDDLRHIGKGWDGWSSVKVLPDHEVVLWRNKGFNGGRTVVSSSTRSLPGKIREDMGSVRVLSPEREKEKPEKEESEESKSRSKEDRRPAATKRSRRKRVRTAGVSSSTLLLVAGGLGLGGAVVYFLRQNSK
jgi:hypothetical protein